MAQERLKETARERDAAKAAALKTQSNRLAYDEHGKALQAQSQKTTLRWLVSSGVCTTAACGILDVESTHDECVKISESVERRVRL